MDHSTSASIFRRLNTLTVKDSHLLPCICETLESLAGAAHHTTVDRMLGSGRFQWMRSPKQYTAFTLGSMGLYEWRKYAIWVV